ncbi:phage tail assembly-like protein [Hirsutella rhossiliensis]|uniref:Phage tail assembly-like protein n=1 Tax=Hirsutella rhossiliensis TaxID=111463 RepID=A0A9P8MMH7_9HYPO|nr:phage tail assembly-like protein [Hirsutella rhossiliensis]KAH0958948.1 phage tail assembly-like protein [Hirsutella rhossiliensis]
MLAAAVATRAVPHIHLLCMDGRFSDAFTTALATYKGSLPSSVSVEIHNMALQFLPPSAKFDLVVSPANSYGRLDGSFDDAISRAFSPGDDYNALTYAAQAELYKEWRGFAPPGTCTLVRIPERFKERSKNVWGTRYLALCPTMRTPQEVVWDREVIYECVWSLLCAIDRHNRALGQSGVSADDAGIRSILITPMATGVGRVSAERWAHQFILAIRHFVDAVENPAKWSALTWDDIEEYADALVDSRTM